MSDLQQGEQEVRSLLKPIFDDQVETIKTKNDSTEGSAGINTKFKTEKCRYWAYYKNCPFGESCNFAHGQIQMRHKIDTPVNYKTKVCINFSKTGFCKYGERCQFKHVVNEQHHKVSKAKSFIEFLDELPNQFGNILPIKRLKVFQQFEQDDPSKINWKYKKPRTYTI